MEAPPLAMSAETARSIVQRVARHPLLALPDATQRGDELPESEREAMLEQALAASPAAFLRRYGRLLALQDLPAFAEAAAGSNALQDELQELQMRLSPPCDRRSALVRNRRWTFLSKKLGSTDYFSVELMAARRPELYEQYTAPADGPRAPHSAASDAAAPMDANQGRSEPATAGSSVALPQPAERWGETAAAAQPCQPAAHWGALPPEPPAATASGAGGGAGAAAGAGRWGEFTTDAPAAEGKAEAGLTTLQTELSESLTATSRGESASAAGGQPRSCGQLLSEIQSGPGSAAGAGARAGAGAGAGAGAACSWGDSSGMEGAAGSQGPDVDSATYQLQEFGETMRRLWLEGQDEGYVRP